jgi:hypothetical protein
MLKIYIPTHGRADGPQSAYHQLNAAGLDPMLVVDESEAHLYDRKRYRLYAAPVKGIAAKRQWIVEHAGNKKFVQVDDDMTIAMVDFVFDGDGVSVDYSEKCRIVKDPSPAFVKRQFAMMDGMLDDYAHGGFHTRAFVNHAEQPRVLNRGYYRQIMGFNPKLWGKPAPRYGGNTAEDVRFMLQLLERGLDYFLITSSCMIENVPKGQKKTWSHWTQDEKNKDMVALAKEYERFAFQNPDGRWGLRYAAILKAAKARNERNV